MPRYVLAVALAGAWAVAGAAAPPSPDPKSLAVPPEQLAKARELVQKLGSEAFAERELAERELAGMGRLARPVLLDAVSTDPDPEVRQRCDALLPRATAAEMKARLDTFLADTDGKYDHDLPGWAKVRATVRGELGLFGWTWAARPNADKAARLLFTDFVTAPGGRELLAALDRDRATAGQLVALRKQELYQAKYPRNGTPARNPSLAEIAVVVFAESQVPSKFVPRAAALTSVVTTSGLGAAIQAGDEKGRALRAVTVAWFDSRTDGPDLYTALTLANNMGLNEPAGRLAARMLSTPGVQGFYRGQALATMVRLKMTDQLPAVERAFTDASVLSTTIRIVNGVQVRQTIEVRDAALAAALVLTDQDPNEYGFENFPKAIGGAFSYTQARLPEDKRKAAFEKWAEWKAKRP